MRFLHTADNSSDQDEKPFNTQWTIYNGKREAEADLCFMQVKMSRKTVVNKSTCQTTSRCDQAELSCSDHHINVHHEWVLVQ